MLEVMGMLGGSFEEEEEEGGGVTREVGEVSGEGLAQPQKKGRKKGSKNRSSSGIGVSEGGCEIAEASSGSVSSGGESCASEGGLGAEAEAEGSHSLEASAVKRGRRKRGTGGLISSSNIGCDISSGVLGSSSSSSSSGNSTGANGDTSMFTLTPPSPPGHAPNSLGMAWSAFHSAAAAAAAAATVPRLQQQQQQLGAEQKLQIVTHLENKV